MQINEHMMLSDDRARALVLAAAQGLPELTSHTKVVGHSVEVEGWRVFFRPSLGVWMPQAIYRKWAQERG